MKSKKKFVIAIVSLLIIAIGIFVADNHRGICHIIGQKIALTQEHVPVLAYHGFVPQEFKYSVSDFSATECIDEIEEFESEMEYLHENGWTTLTIDEFYAWHQKKLDIPEKSCLITFDDGYYEMYHLVYPILKKYNFNAVTFVVGSYTPEITPEYSPAERHMIGWDKIKEIEKNYPGFTFESHSYNLHGYDENGNEPWTSATLDDLKSDFDLMDSYGFEYMAYPYGGYKSNMIKAAKESNIKMAFLYKAPGYAARFHNEYKIPRQKIYGSATYEDFVKIMEGAL